MLIKVIILAAGQQRQRDQTQGAGLHELSVGLKEYASSLRSSQESVPQAWAHEKTLMTFLLSSCRDF